MRPRSGRTSTTILPKSLRDQIGALGDSKDNKHKKRQPLDRKARRKLERQNKKPSYLHTQQPSRPFKSRNLAQDDDDEEVSGSGSDISRPISARDPPNRQIVVNQPESNPTQKRKRVEEHEEAPAPSRPIRKAVLDKLEEDDAEIARLEAKLKIKGKKLPKSFTEDGLDFLLDGLGAGSSGDEETSYKAYLADKRERKRKRDFSKNADPVHRETNTESDSDDLDLSQLGEDSDVDEDDLKEGDQDDEMISDNDDEEEGRYEDEEEGDQSKLIPSQSKREVIDLGEYDQPNPKTKTDSLVESTRKYVPPSLRKPAEQDENLLVLRRKIQGQLNRLSEVNMLQILVALEDIYRNNPRQQVTSTITDLLLTLIRDKATLFDTFMILQGGLMAALYKVMGTDFGAHLVQTITEEFEKSYHASEKNATSIGAVTTVGKRANNLLLLLLELYNFNVISCTLIFDVIRVLVKEMNELNTELLLKIVQRCGIQLRQDDPNSLKDIVIMIQPAIQQAGMQNLSTRTRFMIEILSNLKNNKGKTATATSVVASEATVRMRKTLGTLNARSLRATEPLRVSLQDIQQIATKGKWWLVGASWKNNMHEQEKRTELDKADPQHNYDSEDDVVDVPDLLQMAYEQRMNTDVRRAIFVSIMSAEDFKDASDKLHKLRLKRAQEREIPRVLVHCCGSEQNYNPFYHLIAREQCLRHSTRMTFQFSLWELFRKMGEEDDLSHEDFVQDEDEIEEQLPMRKMVNLAKFYGNLVAGGSLSLTILKTLKFGSLQSRTQTFLEIFFITIFINSQRQPLRKSQRDEKVILTIFSTLQDMKLQAAGISNFLRKHVKDTDIAGGKAETNVVIWGCLVAEPVLRSIAIGVN